MHALKANGPINRAVPAISDDIRCSLPGATATFCRLIGSRIL
jgi:hypothetical protein